MKKVAVVFWSGTGNTEMMANAVLDGAKSAGTEADLLGPADFNSGKIDEYSAIAFGCPSMGAEELEETEFEPMFAECEAKLGAKKIALFGSYGWGTGEWMETWTDRCKESGAEIVADAIICQETPDDDVLDDCRGLGSMLAGFEA